MPIKYKDMITTPHELVYKEKPDYRNLFPIFSVAYVKRYKDGTKNVKKLSKNKKLKTREGKRIGGADPPVGSLPGWLVVLAAEESDRVTEACFNTQND